MPQAFGSFYCYALDSVGLFAESNPKKDFKHAGGFCRTSLYNIKLLVAFAFSKKNAIWVNVLISENWLRNVNKQVIWRKVTETIYTDMASLDRNCISIRVQIL